MNFNSEIAYLDCRNINSLPLFGKDKHNTKGIRKVVIDRGFNSNSLNRTSLKDIDSHFIYVPAELLNNIDVLSMAFEALCSTVNIITLDQSDPSIYIDLDSNLIDQIYSISKKSSSSSKIKEVTNEVAMLDKYLRQINKEIVEKKSTQRKLEFDETLSKTSKQISDKLLTLKNRIVAVRLMLTSEYFQSYDDATKAAFAASLADMKHIPAEWLDIAMSKINNKSSAATSKVLFPFVSVRKNSIKKPKRSTIIVFAVAPKD